MAALRNGHLRHSKGAALTRWRASVFKAAYEAARGLNADVPLDAPVRLRLVFVLPRPKRTRFTLITRSSRVCCVGFLLLREFESE